MSVADYFATFDTVAQSNADTDLGSGGALVLPDFVDADAADAPSRGRRRQGRRTSTSSTATRWGSGTPSSNQNYQDITGALGGAVFSMPAYFNNTLYYGASGGKLKAFPIAKRAAGVDAAASASAASFAYPGTTPSISASGTANGIVWAVENKNPAVLHAYDARDLSHELYNSTQAREQPRRASAPATSSSRRRSSTAACMSAPPAESPLFGMLVPAPAGLRIVPSVS